MMDYLRLVRPRILALVLLVAAVSAWTIAGWSLSWQTAATSLAGAGLVIAGAISMNQRLEWQGDALMSRTAKRPLPAGRLSRRQVTSFGVLATIVGLALLALSANLPLVLFAIGGWLIYVAVYTPLKTRTAWQTPIGAVAGAMPVLLGAAVAGRPFCPWALVIFGIVYFWQFPHSMAIAWRFRQEFAAAGVKVAPASDTTGRAAALLAIIGSASLLPIALLPVLLGIAGAAYATAASVLGIAYLAISIGFAYRPSDIAARRLLIMSLLYLPALLAAVLFA